MDIMVLALAGIAAAITAGLAEYLLGLVLPKQPRKKHVITIFLAFVAFALIAATLPRVTQDRDDPPTPTSTPSFTPTPTPSFTPTPTPSFTPTPTPSFTPTLAPLPPPPNCNPDMIITSPRPGEIVNGRVPIEGTARHPDFAFYKVEYGVGESPSNFIAVSSIVEHQVDDGVLDTWRTDRDVIRNGTYILKLTVVRTDGNEAQPTCSIKVIVQK